jgi:NAD(P)-dependent dehydrogenase (short-subunit alcohol dehydrogenase family)
MGSGRVSEQRRVALVTGAAQGIGRSIAVTLAGRGYALALNDLRPPEATLEEARAMGAAAEPAPGDVSDEAAARGIVEAALGHFGRLDVLVNNAGVSFLRPAEETDLPSWRRVLDVNLTGPFLLSREAGVWMLGRGEGSVVNIASVAGLLGVADRAAYCASKHGLVGLTRTLAAEWGGRGVRVNAVCPGWVKTEMDEQDQAGGGYTDADIGARVPMGRFATPEDVARAVAYLADPELSGYVNGATLSVDGGWLADGSWDSLRGRKR